MYSIKELGFADYYYLDNDKIYNSRTKRHQKGNNYSYLLVTTDRKKKKITIKEIYRKLFNKVFCIDNIELLENEVFKEIKGTEGLYYVSNKGRVKSYNGYKAIILKPTITKKNYARLQICINGVRYNKFVHSLVANAFLEQTSDIRHEVHHIDFNSLNNNANNLKFLSREEHRKIHNKKRRKNYEFCKSENSVY